MTGSADPSKAANLYDKYLERGSSICGLLLWTCSSVLSREYGFAYGVVSARDGYQSAYRRSKTMGDRIMF